MIFVIENFLSDEECDFVCESIRSNYGTYDAEIGVKHGMLDDSLRSTHVMLMKDEEMISVGLDWFIERYKKTFDEYNQKYYNEQIRSQIYQFTKYDSKHYHHYTWHNDDNEMEEGYRKVSSTIQLSDPNSYQGGDFEIKGETLSDYGDWKKKGSMILFPSKLIHRVTTVTSGIRCSMVTWNEGEFDWDKLIYGKTKQQ